MIRRVVGRLRAFFRSDRAEDELAREMASHLELLTDDYLRQGLSPEDARRAARRAFGNREVVKDRQRDERSVRWLEDLRRDTRFGVRALTRSPGFTAAAVATLALGVGASTAIFSVAYGVSLRPLPYREPDRLLRIYESNPANGRTKEDVSVGAFEAWRGGSASLESAALVSPSSTRYLTGDDPQPVRTASVSPVFLDLLGVSPIRGRGFLAEQAYTRATLREIVLSHHGWLRLFGGREDVIGQTLTFVGSGRPDVFRIVGVLPADFDFDPDVDGWRPQIVEQPIGRALRNLRYDRVIARLRPGATLNQARAELEAISQRLAHDHPASNRGWTVTVESLHGSIVGTFGRATWLLMLSTAFVLLVTVVNVGGLLLARGVARQRETAVRLAIGAGRGRLLRMWMAEAAVLGGLGTGAGLALAWTGLASLKAAAPPGIPRLDAIQLDLPALTVAILSGVASIMLFALAPARRLSIRTPVVEWLRDGLGATGDSPKGQRARSLLAGLQCAAATALLVLAILTTRSFLKLMSVETGWDPTGVVSMTVAPPMPPELRRPWYRYVVWSDRLTEALAAAPGISSAAVTTQVPLSAERFASVLGKGRGRRVDDGSRWPGVQHNVTDRYFEVLGISVVDGRTFGAQDRSTEDEVNYLKPRERGVVVVTEATARALWPGETPLGQAVWLVNGDSVVWREVIGVVEDIQFHTVGEAPALHVFVPWTQAATGRPRLVVRGHGSTAATTDIAREIVRRVEPGTAVDAVLPLSVLMRRATVQPRFTSRLVVGFGALALILAAIGIYGTLSYVIGTRRREFGIRIALGASPARIASAIVRHGLTPALVGSVAGLAVAIATARTFRSLLYGVQPFDPGSVVGAFGVVLLVAFGASVLPALRASRVDPSLALRGD